MISPSFLGVPSDDVIALRAFMEHFFLASEASEASEAAERGPAD